MFTLIAIGCGDGTNDQGGAEILMLGDSITSLPGYADLVIDDYGDDVASKHAFPGFATSDFLPDGDFYQAAEVRELRPRVVTILLGTNDASRLLDQASNLEYANNIKAIIDALLRDGTGRVVLIIPPRRFDDHRFTDFVNGRLREYIFELEFICSQRRRVTCAPFLYDLLNEEDFFDGVHPNAAGHELIADALLRRLGRR